VKKKKKRKTVGRRFAFIGEKNLPSLESFCLHKKKITSKKEEKAPRLRERGGIVAGRGFVGGGGAFSKKEENSCNHRGEKEGKRY